MLWKWEIKKYRGKPNKNNYLQCHLYCRMQWNSSLSLKCSTGNHIISSHERRP